MARLYLDEDVHQDLAGKLREKGHDVQTSNEAGNSNKRHPDSYQLNHATENDRTIITNNRRDFNREHIQSSGHKGIISGNHDKNLDRFAGQVDAIVQNNNIENVNVRANTHDFVVENKAGERKTYTYDQPKVDLSHIQQHQSQASSPPAPAPATKSISDFRRGDDQAHNRQKQDDEKRPSEQAVDHYRRSPGRDGKDR